MSLTVVENKTVLSINENGNNVIIRPTQYVVQIAAVGVQGASGDTGSQAVFIQNTEPVVESGSCFMWVQTGLGDGTDFAVFAGTGA